MKAPVGLLSDRTVLRQQDGGASPRQVPVYWEVAENEKSEVYSEVKEVELCRIWKRKQI